MHMISQSFKNKDEDGPQSVQCLPSLHKALALMDSISWTEAGCAGTHL